MTRRILWGRIGFAGLAWLFVILLLIQVLLAGLSLLASIPMWAAHRDLGHMVMVLPLGMLILAYVGNASYALRRNAWLTLGVYAVQAELFAVIRATMPLPAALHPVLALVLFWLAVNVAQLASAEVRRSWRVPAVSAAHVEQGAG